MASVVTIFRNHPCCFILLLVFQMKIDLKLCFKVGLTVFLTYLAISYCSSITGFLSTFLSSLKPLFVGFMIAFVVNIPMSMFEKLYFPNRNDNNAIALTRKPVCLILAFITIIGVVYLLLAMVIPELIHCFAQLISRIPQTYDRVVTSKLFTEWIPKNLPYLFENFEFSSFDVQGLVEKTIQIIGDSIGNVFNFSFSLISSVFSTIVSAVVSIIFSLYILLSKDKLKMQAKRFLSVILNDRIEGVLAHIVYVVNDCFRKFFVGQFTEAIILGVLCSLGMLLFRFPYATMIGAMIGFTALIPVAGAYIGAIFGAIMILTEESFVTALLFVVFIIVLQQLEGNLIYPRVVGSSVGLPALWVLVAVTVGGALGGISGMLISVPIFASGYRLIKEYITYKESSEKV